MNAPLLWPFVAMVATSASVAQTTTGDLYLDGLAKRGYLASIARTGTEVRVIVGRKFQNLGADSAKAEVCQAVYAFFRGQDGSLRRVVIADPTGSEIAACDVGGWRAVASP